MVQCGPVKSTFVFLSVFRVLVLSGLAYVYRSAIVVVHLLVFQAHRLELKFNANIDIE